MKKLQKGKYYRLDYSDYEDNYIIAKFQSEDICFYWEIPHFTKWREFRMISYLRCSSRNYCKIRLATKREIMQLKLLLMIKQRRIKWMK